MLLPEASEDIYERAREPKRLEILAGGGHGLREVVDEVHALLTDFISEAAGDAGEAGPRGERIPLDAPYAPPIGAIASVEATTIHVARATATARPSDASSADSAKRRLPSAPVGRATAT